MRFTPGIVGVGRGAASLVFYEPNTNRVTNPQALNLWTQTSANAAANALNDPDGNLNAETLTDNAIGTTGSSVITSAAVTLVASTLFRCSLYVKAGTVPWVNIAMINLGLTLNAYFNPSTGAAGNIGAGVTASGVDAAIGAGWYRCWFTFTSGADVSGSMSIGLASANGTATILRDGTKTVHAWLAQLAVV